MRVRGSSPLCSIFPLLLLLLVLAAPALAGAPPPAAPRPERLDAALVVFATSSGNCRLSIAYEDPVTPAQVEQDFAALAAQLRRPPVRPRVSHDDPGPGRTPRTSGSAELPGLVNWKDGVILLDPAIAALQRFHHFKASYLFLDAKFPLTWPVGEQRRGPVRFVTQAAGNSVTYDVWIDHRVGSPASLPPTGPGRFAGLWIGFIAAGAGIAVAAIFYLVYVVTRQREPGPPRKESQ